MASGIEKTYQEGEIICRQGDQGEHIYILRMGSVGIYRDNQLIATIVRAGTVLGEMSVILNQKRTATIKAHENCEMSIIRVTLQELVRDFPSFAMKLLQTLAYRLKETTEHLSETMVQLGEDEDAIAELNAKIQLDSSEQSLNDNQ